MFPDSSQLALDLLGELTEPLIVVNREREVIFRSRAFMALCGCEPTSSTCQALLLPPAPSVGKSRCCWSALDAYLACGERGLWQIARDGANHLPVLCELLPVGVGARHGMLALRMRALTLPVSPVALAFFGGLRSGAEQDERYFETAAAYLKSAYQAGFVAWFRADADSAPRLVHALGLDDAALTVLARGLETDAAAKLHDIVFDGAIQPRIAHVFRSTDSSGVVLVLGKLAQPLDERLVDAARAAVAAASSAAPAADLAPRQIVDTALLQVLNDVERKTLLLLAEGLSDKAIARHRGVSLYTVKHQVARIMKKAGVDRRTKLIGRFHERSAL